MEKRGGGRRVGCVAQNKEFRSSCSNASSHKRELNHLNHTHTHNIKHTQTYTHTHTHTHTHKCVKYPGTQNGCLCAHLIRWCTHTLTHTTHTHTQTCIHTHAHTHTRTHVHTHTHTVQTLNLHFCCVSDQPFVWIDPRTAMLLF